MTEFSFPEITSETTDEELRQVAIRCAKALRDSDKTEQEAIINLFHEWVKKYPVGWKRFEAMCAKDYVPGKNFWSESAS